MTRKFFVFALMAMILIPCSITLAQGPLSVTVDIKPATVNFKSKGVVPIVIHLEQGLESPIDTVEVYYLPPDSMSEPPDSILLAELAYVKMKSKIGAEQIQLKYKTQDLKTALDEDASVSIGNGQEEEIALLFVVTLENGTVMEGSDTILAKYPGKGKKKG